MAPHTIPFPVRNSGLRNSGRTADRGAQHPAELDAQLVALNAQDGTLHLLRSGFLISGIAVLCLCLTLWTLGGIGPDGPMNPSGWLTLIVALMCMPFGLLLLLLGGAKWLRNHGLSRGGAPLHNAAARHIPANDSR